MLGVTTKLSNGANLKIDNKPCKAERGSAEDCKKELDRFIEGEVSK